MFRKIVDRGGVGRLEGCLGWWVGGSVFLINSNNDYILFFMKYIVLMED